jgi:hypothetical protein
MPPVGLRYTVAMCEKLVSKLYNPSAPVGGGADVAIASGAQKKRRVVFISITVAVIAVLLWGGLWICCSSPQLDLDQIQQESISISVSGPHGKEFSQIFIPNSTDHARLFQYLVRIDKTAAAVSFRTWAPSISVEADNVRVQITRSRVIISTRESPSGSWMQREMRAGADDISIRDWIMKRSRIEPNQEE